MKAVLSLIIVILVPMVFSALTWFMLPILFRHGSSAAFNLAVGMIVIAIGLWVGAYKLLRS
jgi:hypothetical protein